MEVIPAIDLMNGGCVRLYKGDFDQVTEYDQDPLDIATRYYDAGSARLHLVDLDGAFEGRPVNHAAINEIARNHPELTIQLGGGIRSAKTIEEYLRAGVNYVIIGTKAVDEPEFVGEMCRQFPGNIIVGLDGLHGMVAKNGWKEVTDVSVKSLAMLFQSDGIESIVYTDIGKDGMMGGVNLRATKDLADSVSVPIIASGGVTDMKDIEALVEADKKVAGGVNGGISGVITGRAIYEGTLDLAEAIAYVKNNSRQV